MPPQPQDMPLIEPTGEGSIGPNEPPGSNPKKERIKACVRNVKDEGFLPDESAAYGYCTVLEHKGLLDETGHWAAKLPGGREAAAAFAAELGLIDPPRIEAARPVSDLAEQDQPAWGWLTNLRRQGSRLLADVRQVPAKLAAMLPGRWRHRSAELAKATVARPLYGATDGWWLEAVALLGVQPPAIVLADLPSVDADGSIDGMEVLASGTHFARVGGEVWLSDADLDRIVGNWQQAGSPHLPLKIGHGDDRARLASGAPVVELAADEQPDWSKANPNNLPPTERSREAYAYAPEDSPPSDWRFPYKWKRPDGQWEIHVKGLQSAIAALYEVRTGENLTERYPGAMERLKAAAKEAGPTDETEREEAANMELQEKLTKAEADLAAAKAETDRLLAERETEKAQAAVDAMFARLSVPRDGMAIPVEALRDAGAERVALALSPALAGKVELAAGESPLTLFERVMETARTVPVETTTVTGQAAATDKQAELRTDFERRGGQEVLGCTVDEWIGGDK